MKLRLLLLALVVASAVTVAFGHLPSISRSKAIPPSKVTDTFTLTPAASHNLPRLNFVAQLPNGSPKGLKVWENGAAAKGVVFSPLSEEPGSALILILDDSNSVKTFVPVAQKAAKDLIAEQTAARVAVMIFNNRVGIVQPLTASQNQAEAAVIRPLETHNGSRLYDALSRATQILSARGITSGSVIVLSDGADVQSKTSFDALSKQLAKTHVRVFVVGLTSQSANFSPLRQLASASSGRFISADNTKQLRGAYALLGNLFRSDYLVSFSSQVKPGRVSLVRVTSATESASIKQIMPAYKPTSTPPSSFIAILAAILGALAVFTGGLYFLDRRPRASERLISFIPGAETAVAEKIEEEHFELPKTTYLKRIKWWRSLEGDLDLAQVTPPSPTALVAGAAGWLVICLLVAIFIPLAGLVLLVAPVGLRFYVKHLLNKRRAAFASQMAESLQLLASAMRTGSSLGQSMQIVVREGGESVVASEFERILTDERLGENLEVAISNSAMRMDNRDLEQVAIVASLHRQTGGNMAEIFDRVVDTLRERNEIRMELKTLTAQGRLAKVIVTAMPFGLAGIIMLLNPGYLDPLFMTSVGRIMIVVSLVMISAGYYAIGKIMEINI